MKKNRPQGPVKPLVTERTEREVRYSLSRFDVEQALRSWLKVDDSFLIEFQLESGDKYDEPDLQGAVVSRTETSQSVG
jgi:hypothetical protein